MSQITQNYNNNVKVNSRINATRLKLARFFAKLKGEKSTKTTEVKPTLTNIVNKEVARKDLTPIQNKIADVFGNIYANKSKPEFAHPDAIYEADKVANPAAHHNLTETNYRGNMQDNIATKNYQTDLTAQRITDKHQTGSTKDRTFGMFASMDVVPSQGKKFKTVGNPFIKATSYSGNKQDVAREAAKVRNKMHSPQSLLENKVNTIETKTISKNRVNFNYNSNYAFHAGTFVEIDSKVDFVKEFEDFIHYMIRLSTDKIIQTYHSLSNIAGRDIAKDARNQSALNGRKVGQFTWDDILNPMKGKNLSNMSDKEYISTANKIIDNYNATTKVIGKGLAAKVALQSKGYLIASAANKGHVTNIEEANKVYRGVTSVLEHGKRVKAHDDKIGKIGLTILIGAAAPHFNPGNYSSESSSGISTLKNNGASGFSGHDGIKNLSKVLYR